MNEYEKMNMYKREVGKEALRAMLIVFVGIPVALWVLSGFIV